MITVENQNEQQTGGQSRSMVDYNKASETQLNWILDNKSNFEIAAKHLPPNNGSLNICDFGCSHGKNSMFVLKLIFDGISNNKDYKEGLQHIKVYHEDLPDNDFIEVKKCVDDPELGYLKHPFITDNNIQIEPSFIGKSYYESVVQNRILDLAFCFNSLHWMPEYFPTKYGVGYAAEYDDFELTKKFNEMSSNYLTKWLNLRYDELKPGGIICTNFISNSNLVHLFNKYWETALSENNFQQKDLDKVMIPIYFRPLEVVNEIINQFSKKFVTIHNETKTQKAKFNKLAIRALTKNQILGGLKAYPNIDEDTKSKLYQSFEDSIFSGGNEFLEPTGMINWIVLKKL